MNFRTLFFLYIILFKNGRVCEDTIDESIKEVLFQVPHKEWNKIIHGRAGFYIDVYKVKKLGSLREIQAGVSKEGEDILKKLRINYTSEDKEPQRRSQLVQTIDESIPGISEGRITFKRYLWYEEIADYVEKLPGKSKPYRKISLEAIGLSYQGRPLKLVKIEHPGAKHIMFFDAGIHAREWLSVMTGLHLIQELIEEPEDDPVSRLNWYILPITNPDGFVYSQKHFRMHRKNMNVKGCPEGCRMCGVDLNRNFPFQFRC